MHGQTPETSLIKPRRRHRARPTAQPNHNRPLVVAGLPDVQTPKPEPETTVRNIFDNAHVSPAADASPDQSIQAAPITRDWFRISSGLLISALLLYLAFHSLTEIGRIQRSVDSVPTSEPLSVRMAESPPSMANPESASDQSSLRTVTPLTSNEIEFDLVPPQSGEDFSAERDPLQVDIEALPPLSSYPGTGFPKLSVSVDSAPPIAAGIADDLVDELNTVPADLDRVALRPEDIQKSGSSDVAPLEPAVSTNVDPQASPITTDSNPIQVQLQGTIEKFPPAN